MSNNGWYALKSSQTKPGFVGFYGISTPANHSMPNFVYTYIQPKISKQIFSR